ncbi:MAG: tRNA lysidine(34) synthetase TilS [Candidatus Saccharimonadales bacterium]
MKKPMYIVAVSGGIDSVVLLDALVAGRTIGGVDVWGEYPQGELIVAHFDHGIRDDSAADEQFVRGLAAGYGLSYHARREELGKAASEETARHHRYAFLKTVQDQYNATLVTAHHANDAAETIAINCQRGTGWRGVAVMDTPGVWRPLLSVVKREIYEYAKQYRTTWHEDSTNASGQYLRNRIRQQLTDDDMVWQLCALRARQVELKRAIDKESARRIGAPPYSRYFFSHCGDAVAIELLRALCLREVGMSPTLPMRYRMLHAIKVARAGTVLPITTGIWLSCTRTHFIVETRQSVI